MRHLAHQVTLLAAATMLALAVTACGSDAPTVAPSFDGATGTVAAANLQFQPLEVTLPAGVPQRLILDNQDAGVPHNLSVYQGETTYGTSATIDGPAQAEVRFGPLPAGRYQFRCEIHPGMQGTLVIGP